MKTTISSIKKVFCVAAIFSVVGMSVFASSNDKADKAKTTVTVQSATVSIPKDAELKTIRGKVKVSKKDGEHIISYTSVSDKKYSVVVVDPLSKDELVQVKNKKIYLSGYVDTESMTFYVVKIGHIQSNSDGNAK